MLYRLKKYDCGYPVTENGKMNSKLMNCGKDIDFETDMSKPGEIMTTDLITDLQIVHIKSKFNY